MKTLVIGGGMAGLTYAVIACKNGHDVTVAERNVRVGKKIAATGNGKCNIGNVGVSPACYNKSALVNKILNSVSVEEYRRFLESCGIYTFADNEGRMYPISESAANVVDCLRNQVEKYGGKIICEAEAFNVRTSSNDFEVLINRTNYRFGKVVVACGSSSQSLETHIFSVIPKQYVTPLCPSLTPVKVRYIEPILNGLRVKCKVTLTDGAISLDSQNGEVLFKDYGLSGICIFNLSAVIARRTVQGKQGDYKFVIDLLPNFNQWDLEELLFRRVKSGDKPSQLFFGLLHNKLAEAVLKRCDGVCNVTKLAHTVKNFTFDYAKLLDYSMSQVTSGGVDERYLDARLNLPNGVTVLGEALNVDGICGGNNLYFAAASALYTFPREQRNAAYLKI